MQSLEAECERLDALLDPLVAATAPDLLASYGVGTDTAGALLVSAGDNPERLRSEADWMDKTTNTGGWTLSRPEVRFYRWSGPYIGLHQFWDWGWGFHKAWLGDDLGVLQGIDLRK